MELNVGGNLLGDGFQNGGVLVVEKGGKTLHHYVQDGPADHEDNTTIINVKMVDFRATTLCSCLVISDANPAKAAVFAMGFIIAKKAINTDID